MRKKTIESMTSSVNEHWNTPETIIKPMVARFGQVALDPCSNAGSIVDAKLAYSGPEVGGRNGLVETWQVDGVVFSNPPYGRKIRLWTKKAAEEAKLAKAAYLANPNGPMTEIILLGPARTDTKYFQEDICPTADAVCLLKGRLTFLHAPSTALFPSFIAYWGPRPVEFKLAFIGMGWYM
jgi:site-specific DNA-methyltransferase (adenine-specific)